MPKAHDRIIERLPAERLRVGEFVVDVATREIAHADANFPQRPFEADKAWREQVHRILVGVLSLLTFALAAWAACRSLSVL